MTTIHLKTHQHFIPYLWVLPIFFQVYNSSLENLNLLWFQDTLYFICKPCWKFTQKCHRRKWLRCVTGNVKIKSHYRYLGSSFIFVLGNSQITILPDNNAHVYRYTSTTSMPVTLIIIKLKELYCIEIEHSSSQLLLLKIIN